MSLLSTKNMESILKQQELDLKQRDKDRDWTIHWENHKLLRLANGN